jgi:hypothetical protein
MNRSDLQSGSERTGGIRRESLLLVAGRLDVVALGVSVGLAAGIFIAGLTVATLVRGSNQATAVVSLFGAYFFGYTVSWAGAVVGFVYAFVAGFSIGAAAAALRNLGVSSALAVARTEAELTALHEGLDGRGPESPPEFTRRAEP